MAVSVLKPEEAVVDGPRETFAAVMDEISFGRMTKFFFGGGAGSGNG